MICGEFWGAFWLVVLVWGSGFGEFFGVFSCLIVWCFLVLFFLFLWFCLVSFDGFGGLV